VGEASGGKKPERPMGLFDTSPERCEVCYWHLADSFGGLGARPLLGVKQTFLATVQLMPVYEYALNSVSSNSRRAWATMTLPTPCSSAGLIVLSGCQTVLPMRKAAKELTQKETARIRDEALKRALNTPVNPIRVRTILQG
jgi:hypothetical protein